VAIKVIRKMKAFNRRKHARVNINCLVRFHSSQAGSAEKTLTNLIDLSAGGALLNTFDTKLKLKSQVEVEFQLPGDEVSIMILATVTRAVKKRGGNFQAGVQFKDIQKQDFDRLQKFIAHCVRPRSS